MFQFRVCRLASCNDLYVEVVISFFGDLSIRSATLKGKEDFVLLGCLRLNKLEREGNKQDMFHGNFRNSSWKCGT
jgi:hypothetical protein